MNGDPVVADLPLFFELFERFKDAPSLNHAKRRVMKLIQIDDISVQALEALFHRKKDMGFREI